jgi:radical SAM peptide maturase (CXXX-repeat target family)
MNVKGTEEFGSYLSRLYPNETSKIGKVGARTATIQVTDACNLRCTYCYQINKGTNYIDVEMAKKFIDMLLSDDNEYINTKLSAGLILDFIGGEPLLAIDIIDELTRYVIAEMVRLKHPWLHRFRISICSNGTLYFDSKVQNYLRRYSNIISFSISIDGNKELHDSCRIFPDGSGSYDIAMKAVNHYRKTFNRSIDTKMTLSPYNIYHTFDAIKNLIENKYTTINFNCVFEEGWTKEHAKIYYQQLKQIADYYLENKLYDSVYLSRFDPDHYGPMSPEHNENYCGGLGDMIAINYTGNIYPCIRYMESSLGDDVPSPIIGDIESGIMKKDKYSELVSMMKSCTRRSQSTDECFYCPIASGCAWCSAYNYQKFGCFNKRATYICDMHKAEALANTYYWNKFYLLVDRDDYKENHCPKEWAIDIIGEEEFNSLENLVEQAKSHCKQSINNQPKEDTI